MKRVLSIIVITVLLVTATGCGNKQEEISNTSGSAVLEKTSKKASEETETVQPEDKPEAAVSSSAETEPEDEETEATEESKVPDTSQKNQKDQKGTTEKASEKTENKKTENKNTAGQQSGMNTNTNSNSAAENKDRSADRASGQAVAETSGGKTAESPSNKPAHSCTWDGGSVTTSATCSGDGVKTYTCTGCGKTKTETIPKTSHNYVTETTPATCTEGGKTKTYCSICGNVQSETSNGAPTGHNFVKSYWPSAPTCSTSGHYYLKCSACGASGGEGDDPRLPHTPMTVELCHGNCRDYTVTETTCRICGAPLGKESHNEPNDHNYVEVTEEIRNMDTLEMETITYTRCSRCGLRP